MGVRIYKYGLPFGPEEAEMIDEIIWRAHRHQNRLIELELDKRAAYRATLAAHSTDYADACTEISALEAELSEVRSSISDQNSSKRSRSVTKSARKEVKGIKAAIRAARKRRGAAKKQALKRDDVGEAVDLVDERFIVLQKLYRSECTVHWGTRNLIEDAVKQASKSRQDPRFVRWRGRGENGRVGIQIQGGMSVDELFGCEDTRIQIEPVDPRAWDPDTPRGERKRLCRTTLRLRVGSEGPGNRTPVWSTWKDLHVHRPLPDDAVIKWAWVKRKKVGTRYRWSLQLTVVSDTFDAPAHPAPNSVAGIDVGWRKRLSGLRFAYVDCGDDHYELLLDDAAFVDRFDHADSLLSIRDREFNEFRDVLADWVDGDSPEWFKADLSHVSKWRSKERMRKFVWKWSENRFGSDGEMFEAAEAWRKQDRHLHQWHENQTRKTLNRRKERYRILAKKLCERHGVIVLEDLDLSRLAKLPEPEEDKNQHGRSRNLRKIAAIGEFRDALELMASKTGTEIIRVDPAYTTMSCHRCGEICDWDAASQLRHACEHCGAEWDQDLNAARNLLNSYKCTFSDAAE